MLALTFTMKAVTRGHGTWGSSAVLWAIPAAEMTFSLLVRMSG